MGVQKFEDGLVKRRAVVRGSCSRAIVLMRESWICYSLGLLDLKRDFGDEEVGTYQRNTM